MTKKKSFSLLGVLLLTLLSACKKEAPSPQSTTIPCNQQTPTQFASGESPKSLTVNFLGNTIQACAGTQIPIIVSGTYRTNKTYCSGNYIEASYTTNPTNQSDQRMHVIDNGCLNLYDDPTACVNYNTLDCSNFIFTVRDASTGEEVGSVTKDCNLILNSNTGKKTIVTAHDLTGSAFWPESGTQNPGNILTCN